MDLWGHVVGVRWERHIIWDALGNFELCHGQDPPAGGGLGGK